jgi:hypothetical protein
MLCPANILGEMPAIRPSLWAQVVFQLPKEQKQAKAK